MDVAYHVVAQKAGYPLEAFTDDGRAQMADMHWLGNISAAVIDDDLLWRWGLGTAVAHIGCHRTNLFR